MIAATNRTGRELSSEFVVARGDISLLLDFVEEYDFAPIFSPIALVVCAMGLGNGNEFRAGFGGGANTVRSDYSERLSCVFAR
jgi:hypothetical protein